MRPKKIVLCVDADEERLSRMTVVLETWGYRVEQSQDAVQALEAVEAHALFDIDAMLVDAELLGAENLIARARAVRPAMQTMLLGYGSSYGCVLTQANVFLPSALCFPAEIRERLKVLTARKRGPRAVFAAVQEAVA